MGSLATMLKEIVIEQRQNDEFRNQYSPIDNSFKTTTNKCLLYIRNFNGVYGWIKDTGTPPESHLDILVPTRNNYDLGEILKVRIIGCFIRRDNDNKFVGVEINRDEKDIADLSYNDLENLKAIYPIINENEGWFGRDKAIELINKYYKSNDINAHIIEDSIELLNTLHIFKLVDIDQKVIRWPKKHKEKLVVLKYISSKLEKNKEYSESEINCIIKKWHLFNDHALIRREMVDNHIIYRTEDCRKYWV